MKNSIQRFYTLIITQMVSLIGSRMTGVAIGIWVFAETGDAAPLLIAAFFAELPSMFGGIFTGWLADKWDRRYIMILGDVGQAAGTIILLISISTGNFHVWILYAVSFLQGIFAIVQEPAAAASITMLVPENQRDRANGLREIGFNLAGVLAPALSGIVYSFAGLEAVIALDLTTFLLAIAVVFSLNIPMPAQSEEGQAASESLWKEFLGGWHFLRSRPVLLIVVFYLAFLFFLMNGPLEMTIPYMSSVTEDEAVLGILLSLFSFGALSGSMTITIFGKLPNRMLWILFGYLFHGLMMIIYGVSRDVWWMGISVFLMMYPLPLAGALFSTILQSKTPPDMQGRIFALTGQIFTLTTPFSFLITAYLVDNVLEPAVGTESWNVVAPIVGNEQGAGMGLILVIVGAIIALSSLIMLLWRAARELESRLPSYQAQ